MHTFNETGAGVPAFLAKLWRLVEDPETNNLICWSKDGRSFIIQNQAQFARELLPLNYKHNNMASFIRQLNMYGFHKITSIDNGGLKFDRDEMEFTHPCFKRNCPYLLEHIKRKIASSKSVDEKSVLKPEAVTKVLQDVKAMRGRQDSLDSRFSVMKQENEALWREIASLRQKHAKQQQIVNKLIQFLITIVQPQRNMTGVKRHMQLMINDTPNKSKMRKTSESDSECGPVIHELSEELLEEVSEIEPEIMVPNSPFTRVITPATPTNDPDLTNSPHNRERPHSNISMVSQHFEFSNQSAEDSDAIVSGTNVNEGLIQTVNNDGSKIFYHITEVPDVQPQESNTDTVNYDEDNVLATPMVREEMARNQLLKQKSRQKRYKIVGSAENRIKEALASNTKVQQVDSQQQVAHNVLQPMLIKSEQDPSIDPMIFLNAYPHNRGQTPDPNLISPNFSEDSRHSNSNTTGGFSISSTSSAKAALPTEDVFMTGNGSDFYNPNSFITNDIPADIFEENSLTSAEENVQIAENDNFKKAQKFGLPTVNSGKFATFLSESTSQNGLQPSTSAAAAAAAVSLTNNGNNNNVLKRPVTGAISPPTTLNENGRKIVLTKFKNNQDLMRLSTADDVSGHIDTVQDELEGLKDLLRSDVYSLDQNALLGVSLSNLNAHDDEETNYEDAINITAGSKQASNFIENDNDDEVPLDEINTVQNSKLNTFLNNNHQIFMPLTMGEDILNKLFTDSDILGPYGLHLSNDGSCSNEKKELMTYQPMYDLSDIINDQNDLDADVNIPTTSNLQTQQQPKQEYSSSVLNTPYHE